MSYSQRHPRRFMNPSTLRSAPSSLVGRAPGFATGDYGSSHATPPYQVNRPERYEESYDELRRPSYETAPRYRHEDYDYARVQKVSAEDMMRRRDHDAERRNGSIMNLSEHAKLCPKVTSYHDYPSDFSHPKRVEDFKHMSDSQLDRIMTDYGLDSHSSGYDDDDYYGYGSSKRERCKNLVDLFDHLGALELAEALRDKLRRHRGGRRHDYDRHVRYR